MARYTISCKCGQKVESIMLRRVVTGETLNARLAAEAARLTGVCPACLAGESREVYPEPLQDLTEGKETIEDADSGARPDETEDA